MKKLALLLLVASALVFAKNSGTQSHKKAPAKQPVETAEEVQPAAEEPVQEPVVESIAPTQEETSLEDSKFTLYIHPMNFLVPYSHFWGGIWIPHGLTDYPTFNLTFEWRLFEKSSLVTMPHFVRVDRTGENYRIRDIGLQESFRWYGVTGRWRYFQAGLLLSRLHVATVNDGGFDGWLYGFMFHAGVKKILNGGEGFLGKFAVSFDIGLGYAWVSDFDADRKQSYFEMDKGLSIDVNAAIGFQI